MKRAERTSRARPGPQKLLGSRQLWTVVHQQPLPHRQRRWNTAEMAEAKSASVFVLARPEGEHDQRKHHGVEHPEVDIHPGRDGMIGQDSPTSAVATRGRRPTETGEPRRWRPSRSCTS